MAPSSRTAATATRRHGVTLSPALLSRTALGVPVMAPSSRTTASWSRSPGAATQSALSSRQAIASLSGAIPQGPRSPLLVPTAPRDGVTCATSQLEQQAVGPRVMSADRSRSRSSGKGVRSRPASSGADAVSLTGVGAPIDVRSGAGGLSFTGVTSAPKP